MSPNPRLCLRARSRALLLISALLLAAPVFAQQGAKESFLAIQRQVETLQPSLIKSTVNLRVGGASGSGVIISPDGYVLTAAHVIAGRPNRRCMATLSDGRNLPATVMGSDSGDDFGLVKIRDAQDLQVAQLGDSDALQPGEWVVATGHPLGFHSGRPPVLRIGRVLFMPAGRRWRQREIMTDVPLISGDSGGPLFDLTGRVVGINSMINSVTPGRSYPMSSFHVPANLAAVVLDTLKRGENATPSDVRGAPALQALRDARMALQTGDAPAALRAAAESVRANPNSAVARFMLARAYAHAGKAADAGTALVEACDRGFDDVRSVQEDPDLARVRNTPAVQRALARVAVLSGIPGGRKGAQSVLAQAANMVPAPGRSVVRIEAGDADVALGTVVSADGDVLTKASELPKGPLSCVLPDGKTVPAERQGVDAAWDVALLKVKSSGLEAARFEDGGTVGSWTFSPNASGSVAAIGMVGVAQMPVPDKGSRPASKAFMGVGLEKPDADALAHAGVRAGVGVAEVQPGYPAAQAGVRPGDIILEVDSHQVLDPDALMDLFLGKKPGDTAVLKLARGDERLSVTVNLADRPAELRTNRDGLSEEMTGPLSQMQGPFPRVIEHDAALKPEMMGGPVLDSSGRCIGLNIARADRVCTYAIAARDLKDIYARLRR